ncbi:MAG: transposase [Bacillota bacterium]|nr:transposase [Bacillota bacterium]MDW7676592.1 transposase [Bacillota bacterium]
MPRTARKKSRTGIYHVIMRGNNRDRIFHCEQDYGAFLKRLRKYRDECGFGLYAYCLMDNHVHLLLKEEEEPLSDAMRRLCGSFVGWYNKKYDRIGHLFQDRFRSEVVEDDAYLATALRYIHRNPVKAGLCDDPADFPWSSCRELMQWMKQEAGSAAGDGSASRISPSACDLDEATGHNPSSCPDLLVDPYLVCAMFHADPALALERFDKFHRLDTHDRCLDIDDDSRKWSDEELRAYISMQWKLDPMRLRGEKPERRVQVVRALLQLGGVSSRQLARLTDISPSALLRMAKNT